jgi:hypothetical protein
LLFHWLLARPTRELVLPLELLAALLSALSWVVRSARRSAVWQVRRLVES